jgi:hypothetical protein
MDSGRAPVTEPLSEQANKHMIDSVKAEKPSSFTVGAHADILNKNVEATVSYDRSWKNGLGLTAYLRAWYHDQAIVPSEKRGVTVGGEGSFKF